jgi:archaellum component FlaC
VWHHGILQVHEKRKDNSGSNSPDQIRNKNPQFIKEEIKATEDWHNKLFTTFNNAKNKQTDSFSTLEELDTLNKVQDLFL